MIFSEQDLDKMQQLSAMNERLNEINKLSSELSDEAYTLRQQRQVLANDIRSDYAKVFNSFVTPLNLDLTI